MTLFRWGRRLRASLATDEIRRQLEEQAQATQELEERVVRLERDSEVFAIKRKRELRTRGIQC